MTGLFKFLNFLEQLDLIYSELIDGVLNSVKLKVLVYFF